MLRIYRSVKSAVLLLPLSPIQRRATSPPPRARKGRQTPAPHTSVSREPEIRCVPAAGCSSRLNTTPNPARRVSSFLRSTRAAGDMRPFETPKPLREGCDSSAGNPACRQAGQMRFLILPPSDNLRNSHHLEFLTEQEAWKSGNRSLPQRHKSDGGLFCSLRVSFMPPQPSIPVAPDRSKMLCSLTCLQVLSTSPASALNEQPCPSQSLPQAAWEEGELGLNTFGCHWLFTTWEMKKIVLIKLH